MKCSFCGKELEAGAEFCSGCGMILSLGGASEEPETTTEQNPEIPEYTPNVFKAMDIEQEPAVPAMELEVDDAEETAVVVEAIPEYVNDEAETVTPTDEEEALSDEAQEEEIFVAPEYDPNAEISAEFANQSYEAQTEDAEDTAEQEDLSEAEDTEPEADEIPEEVTEEVAEEQEAYTENQEDEFAPPEYDSGNFEVTIPDQDESYDEEPEAEEAYPAYDIQANESVPEEELTEDENLFAALFEADDSEKIEDITPTDEKPEKGSKKSIFSIVLLLAVLVGVVFAGGYVFKNVLPKIVDTSNTTTAATDEKVDATAKPDDKTTTDKADKTTTENKDTDKTTTEKESTTEKEDKETTTKKPEKETTTRAPETTTEPSTESNELVVQLPSWYNVDEVPFFPIGGDIGIKAGPSADYADMIIHPYGYPVYAYAKEGSFYYVHSPILDCMGWVSEYDIEEYVEPTTAAPVTDAPEETPSGDSGALYYAVISSDVGLNFRMGPGSDYEIKYTVPGGYRVRVTEESSENPGWVYVVIDDASYPYGSPSGWVSSEFLA